MKEYKLKQIKADEWELAPEEPATVKEMQGFFAPPDPEEEIGKLAYKELCPELLGEYKRVKERLEALQDIQKSLRAEIVKLSGGEPGAHIKGPYTLVIKPRAGQVKVNYEAFIEDEIGTEALQELLAMKDLVKQGKSTSKYVEQGEAGVSIEVVEQPK